MSKMKWRSSFDDKSQLTHASGIAVLAESSRRFYSPGRGYEFQSSYASFHKVLGVSEELFSSKKGN